MLHKLLIAADSNVNQAQRGIIYIDEVDKITRSDNATMTRDVSGAPSCPGSGRPCWHCSRLSFRSMSDGAMICMLFPFKSCARV